MNKVLVTGASGMLGMHLVEQLLDKDIEVVSLVNPGSLIRRPWSRGGISRRTEVIEASVLDRERLKNALSQRDFDAVIHTVAVVGGNKREMRVNYGGTVNLIKSLYETSVFVYVSAILALGDTLRTDASETAECMPRTWFEKSKCRAERFIAEKSVEYGWRSITVRPVWIYGKYTRNPDIPRLLKLAKRGFAPILGGKDTPLALVSAEDVASAIIHLINHRGEGIYNVRGPRMYTSGELASALLNAARGKDEGFKITVPQLILSMASRFMDILRYIELTPEDVPIDKLVSLRWKPKVDLFDGLKAVADWMKSNSLL